MSEGMLPSTNDLELSVFGSPVNSDLAQEQFVGLNKRYAEALDRGEPEEIASIEVALGSLVSDFPKLRSQISDNE